jgi:Fe-S cluster assembly protein SufD
LITDKLNYSPLVKAESNNALDQFKGTLYPSKKEEEWRYSPLKKLKKIPFINDSSFVVKNLNFLNLPKLEGNILVLENGRFNQNLSSIDNIHGLNISFISNSKENYPYSTNLKTEDYFSLLNSSYLSEGIVIKVDGNAKIKEIVNVLNIVSSNNCLVNTKIDVFLNENSSLHLKQYFIGNTTSKNGFINHLNNISIKENASLVLDKFQDLNLNFNISNDCINQGRSSKVISNTFSTSGLFTRNNVTNNVNGEHCHSELNGVFSPSENEYIDNHTVINHFVANCKSFENFKGIVKGNGVGVFNGKVIVHENAQKIEAFQNNKNILLDKESIIYSKPELEIYADDVKCSHGSTTGQFDDEAIFYLRARGVSLKKSKELMILGFINEVIKKCNNIDYQDFIIERLLNN